MKKVHFEKVQDFKKATAQKSGVWGLPQGLKKDRYFGFQEGA